MTSMSANVFTTIALVLFALHLAVLAFMGYVLVSVWRLGGLRRLIKEDRKRARKVLILMAIGAGLASLSALMQLILILIAKPSLPLT